MKLEKSDYLLACSYYWTPIIDNKKKIIHFIPSSIMYFPSIVDIYMMQHMGEGEYCIPIDGNEELELELLKLDKTLQIPRDE